MLLYIWYGLIELYVESTQNSTWCMLRPQHMISCLQLDGKGGWWSCRVCVLHDNGACVLSHSVVLKSLWPHGLYPPGSSVHDILQAQILEWVAIPFSKTSSWSSDQTQVSCTAGRFLPSEPPGKPSKNRVKTSKQEYQDAPLCRHLI